MSRSSRFGLMPNGTSLSIDKIPVFAVDDLVRETSAELSRGARLVSWFGVREQDVNRLIAVVGYDADNLLGVARSEACPSTVSSLTVEHPQAHLFEREVFEQFGIEPIGHPWLKPVREYGDAGPGVIDFFRVDGDEVHEVAVGPIHAGVIEPGHFRFQCAGEEMLHVEIALGYQHRGIEKALLQGPHLASVYQMECIAGDTTIGHATAHAMVMESLASDEETPLRAQWLRAIALELERLANHTGDIGAMAGDVAFLPTASACGKIRGDFLNLTARICGNRFGRGLVRPGGCRQDVDEARQAQILKGLDAADAEVTRAMSWLWDAASVRARFENTGPVTSEQAIEMGLVGPVARACGLVRDARADHPAGWHRFAELPVATWPGGDVSARAQIRTLEIERSINFVRSQIQAPPDGDLFEAPGTSRAGQLAVSLVEGWRGEICHVAMTDADSKLLRYKITDPSFHNWIGLALCLRGQAISDFPICNKSFNLSYCGFDL